MPFWAESMLVMSVSYSNPLRYSCLENPKDGGAWWAAVLGSLRVGHNWATSLSLFSFLHWRRKWEPLQCSCLETPRDGGAWWAAISGVAQSQTRLKRLSSSKWETKLTGHQQCIQKAFASAIGKTYPWINITLVMVNKDQNEDILYILATQKYLAHRKIKPQNLAKKSKIT